MSFFPLNCDVFFPSVDTEMASNLQEPSVAYVWINFRSDT